MYSVTGEADASVLSPYPLVPNIATSQPVAKIYLEKNGGFSKAPVSTPVVNSNRDSEHPLMTSVQMSPIELGLITQKMFRAFSTFCHGFLAGIGEKKPLEQSFEFDDNDSPKIFLHLYFVVQDWLHGKFSQSIFCMKMTWSL